MAARAQECTEIGVEVCGGCYVGDFRDVGVFETADHDLVFLLWGCRCGAGGIGVFGHCGGLGVANGLSEWLAFMVP